MKILLLFNIFTVAWVNAGLDFSKVEMRPNPVFFGKAPLSPDELWFSVEIPQGSNKKYEFRTATGQLFLDRVLCPRKVLNKKETVSHFPAHYGIASGLFNVDGDPLDLVVLGADRHYQKQIQMKVVTPRRVRVLGVMLMDECDEVPCTKDNHWVQDWKVIGVDINDSRYSSIHSVSELPKEILASFKTFWSNYKGDVRGYPQTRVEGFIDKKKALKFVNNFKVKRLTERNLEKKSCNDLFAQILREKKKVISANVAAKNPPFLKCLNRVFYPNFFRPEHVDFFLKYSAFQLLIKLGEVDINLDTALDKMKDRKDKSQIYYRFVGLDLPRPGTGRPIFEWVKTLDRNQSCPKDFPSQHYHSRPVVDMSI